MSKMLRLAESDLQRIAQNRVRSTPPDVLAFIQATGLPGEVDGITPQASGSRIDALVVSEKGRAMNKPQYALGRLKTGERNKTEAAYESTLQARQIAGEVVWYRFEGIKLRLADNTFYTPDFAVMLSSGQIELHEVKGAMAIFQDDAKVKIKVAAEAFPFRFLVVIPRAKKVGGGWDIREVGNGN